MCDAPQKRRILVVEDEIAIQQVLSFFLKHHDFEALAAFDGREAIRLIPVFEPDLIILDLMMYPMSGWEVLRWMHANRLASPIPVLVMSSLVNLSDQMRAFEAGAIEYVTKPAQPSMIMERVRALLALTAEQRVRLQSERIDEQRRALARITASQSDEFVY